VNVIISSGVDRLYGRIGFSQQIQNFNLPVKSILNDCKGDLEQYIVQYQKAWIYKNSNRVEIMGDLVQFWTGVRMNDSDKSIEIRENLVKVE
jgi:hypothetical protein